MSKQIFESILSKLGELIVDGAQNNVNSMKDFDLTLKTLQKNLKSLRAKTSDVKEEIKKSELSGQKKRKREVEEWLEEVESIETEVAEFLTEVESEGVMSRFTFGGKAAQLNEQVCKLAEQTLQFGELVVDVYRARGVTLLTTTMIGEKFEQNLEILWKLLEEEDVSRIGVHGMGGAGKTTLVKQINNRLVEQSQGGVFWVTVSQDFTIKSLQDKIAHSVGEKDLLDGNDEVDIRAAKLYKALFQKMKDSVLILDDVWENIDLLKVGCPISKECCRLIITTRSLEVCHQIGCQARIAVQNLDEDDAWKLFSETQSLGEEMKLSPQVEEIAKCVARLCDGLPLAIIIVAGSMRGETSIHTWRKALADLNDYKVGKDAMGEEVEVFRVLKYSFDRLKMNHQSENNTFNLFQLCFLYCSLYPEDSEIPRVELVRNFISEGLLDHRKSTRAQFDQGYCILDKLVKVCLLESCVKSFEDIECVKMHDLVRGMALQIGGGKYLVRAGDESLKDIPMEEEWTVDLEKVSLMKNGIMGIQDGTSPDCPSLSTLLLQDNPDLEFIPESFFTKMQGLCTLNLCQTKIKMLPNSLSELKSLKALLLYRCECLEYVPYLGNLKALRELNLDYTAIKEVPQGVGELLNLKLLSIYTNKLEVFPGGFLLRLVHLQRLRLPNHLQVAIEEVENLKELEEFWGRLNNVPDFNCFIKSRMLDHTFYTIQVGSFSGEGNEDGFRDFNKKVVILKKCNLNDEKVLLEQDIECLKFSDCEGVSNCFLDEFSPSNYPTSLKELTIDGCGGIECIVRSEQELASHFSSLEYLHLEELRDFEGIFIEKGGMELEGVFSSLRQLNIDGCNKTRKLGLSLWEFPSLEMITIRYCSEIEEIFEDEGRSASLSLILPKLQHLNLIYLPRLTSVCKATIIGNSIKTIFISNCNKMRKLGVLEFPNLEEITIWCCSEIEEIFEDEGRAASLSLPRLRKLSLCSLPRLKRVCKATILAFPNLQEIKIEFCYQIEEIFKDEGMAAFLTLPQIRTLPRLRELRLHCLLSLKSLYKATIICNSIQQIHIWRCPRLMKKLPLHLDVPRPLSLRKITVEREWWESLEWDNPNLPTLLQPLVHFSI